MERSTKTDILAALREKANTLPLSPGVYLMKDKDDRIIYVGKSKALKNRVSQYFHENADHNRKTALMVSQVRSFDVMLTDTEMEALSLENRLIKLHTPKYNIRLKDAKSYPYIKVTLSDSYPRLSVVRKRSADKAAYFGPYSGISAAYAIVASARKCFGIPSCKKTFPRDIGKTRPCLNLQLGLCPGVCTGQVSEEDYAERIAQLLRFLRGSFTEVQKELQEKMDFAAENLMFEAAAVYRDRIEALFRLRQKQKIIASPDVELDAFSLYTDDTCTVLTAFFVRSGIVSDAESFRFSAEQIVSGDTLTSFLCDLYEKRTFIPRQILIGFDLPPEMTDLLESWLGEQATYRVTVTRPQRGDKKALVDLVTENARRQAEQYRFEKEKEEGTASRLASLLALPNIPHRIESFDISNYGAEHITAGKVVMEKGKFVKSAYRTYSIKSTDHPDDYAAMREAVARRLSHDEDPYPDLILLDGGKGHVSVIRDLLAVMDIHIPVFGMVKDDYHKTRALCAQTEEISIAGEQAVFVMLYRLQEEVHRFTVSRMTQAKRKTLKTSSLTAIPGIGAAKAKTLLMAFDSLESIKEAPLAKLAAVKGISARDAGAIFAHFHPEKEPQT